MDFAFTEEQEELRSAARAFLLDHSDSEHVRAAMESERGHDPAVWKRIAMELGWPAVTVPEARGGLGLGPVELAALLEVTGEALLCAPLFSTVCLGGTALGVAGSDAQQEQWLPGIAEGDTLATLAWAEEGEACDPATIETRAVADGDGFRLEGTKRFVLDGHVADLLVVAARAEDDVALFAVPADCAGIARAVLPTMDQTRRLATVELRGVRVPAAARLVAGDETSLRRVLDLAAIGLAAEQVGGAQRCLDLSVAYAKERRQFGRPIGAFQALKHKIADMMVALEAARSATYYAACIADEGREDLGRFASAAKAAASEAFFHCAADALQIHGGVGFTWEYDVHLYLKRARAGEGFLGAPAWHRERIARELGL